MIMNTTRVAVVGSGISGAVCASTLARNGVSVTLFESARVPGGRMSQRREVVEDGKELLFDHCAPFFNANNTEFGASVGRLEWLEDENLWSLMGSDGQNLGQFKGVVATDKNLVLLRFTSVTGRQPLPDLNLVPELSVKLNDIPARPCFALVIAFSEPQSSIPFKGFSIRSSEVLSWAHCESSKPGRSTSRECPFPAASVARVEKCLWYKNKRLAICGDFCVSLNVEGAIASRIAAASKLTEILGCL